jgi:hypothetical protein
MTEEEAKKKWCPMVRTGLTMGMAVNHHVDMTPGGQGVHDETRCIASDCMMWRQYVVPIGKKDEFAAGGYCGLAGK